MTKVVALPLAGAMGAGLGGVLAGSGMTVLTCLDGRSDATRARAKAAGLTPAPMEEIARADIILSVVPPHIAISMARDIAALVPAGHAPIFADLNAISPDSMNTVAATLGAAGLRCIDGGIIGPPPKAGGSNPVIYISGDEAEGLMPLRAHGLDLRIIDGGIGAASALKMCYAGMTKGTTALHTAMMGAGERTGIGAVLHAELARSRPGILKEAGTAVPGMFPKAYRWIDEMRQIAAFLGDRPEAGIWRAIAEYYEVIASDVEGERTDITQVTDFLSRED